MYLNLVLCYYLSAFCLNKATINFYRSLSAFQRTKHLAPLPIPLFIYSEAFSAQNEASVNPVEGARICPVRVRQSLVDLWCSR